MIRVNRPKNIQKARDKQTNLEKDLAAMKVTIEKYDKVMRASKFKYQKTVVENKTYKVVKDENFCLLKNAKTIY